MRRIRRKRCTHKTNVDLQCPNVSQDPRGTVKFCTCQWTRLTPHTLLFKFNLPQLQSSPAMPAAATPPESAITIYAELLSFIGQVSVSVSLATATTSQTCAEIVENGSVIRFHHDGCARSMKLPASVAQSASLPLPENASQQVSWRLPAATKASRSSTYSLENQALPWNAVDIKPRSSVKCRKCSHSLIKDGTINVWKDLPSENWAEMMEFWHCHKPHDHEEHLGEEHLTKRGYGASNAISAQASVGFVDITSFVFIEEDCDGLSVSQPWSTGLCSTGEKEVGPPSHDVVIDTTPQKQHSSFSSSGGQPSLCDEPFLANGFS